MEYQNPAQISQYTARQVKHHYLLKDIDLTLNFWHRVTNLPDTALVKKAMLENIKLRTNWIMTIEKLINRFHLAEAIGIIREDN